MGLANVVKGNLGKFAPMYTLNDASDIMDLKGQEER